MTKTPPLTSEQVGAKYGFRSGLEEKAAAQIAAAGLEVQFETRKIPFFWPARAAKYTPDFWLPNGIIIETKGRFF